MQDMPETWVQSLGGEDPLEEEMASHSSIRAWRIPWTEEPGGVQFMAWQSQTLSRHVKTLFPLSLLFMVESERHFLASQADDHIPFKISS